MNLVEKYNRLIAKKRIVRFKNGSIIEGVNLHHTADSQVLRGQKHKYHHIPQGTLQISQEGKLYCWNGEEWINVASEGSGVTTGGPVHGSHITTNERNTKRGHDKRKNLCSLAFTHFIQLLRWIQRSLRFSKKS